MSAAIRTYRAKADCRAGGFFRKKGDVFEMPVLTDVPAHLEYIPEQEVASQDASEAANKKGKKKARHMVSIPKNAQVTKQDIGAATPKSAQDVTSVDILSM